MFAANNLVNRLPQQRMPFPPPQGTPGVSTMTAAVQPGQPVAPAPVNVAPPVYAGTPGMATATMPAAAPGVPPAQTQPGPNVLQARVGRPMFPGAIPAQPPAANTNGLLARIGRPLPPSGSQYGM
jgi:hypothetical protein